MRMLSSVALDHLDGAVVLLKGEVHLQDVRAESKMKFIKMIKHWVTLPRQKVPSIQKSCQVPKVWSVFICANFIVHVPQVRPFFILLELCARVCDKRKILKSNLKNKMIKLSGFFCWLAVD